MSKLIRNIVGAASGFTQEGMRVFTLKSTESAVLASYVDRSGNRIAPTDSGDYYTLQYPVQPDAEVMVYTETYSNFNGTSNPTPYTYTSKFTNTVSETYQGSVSADFPDIASFSFSFTYQATVTCEQDISVTATASPNQWLTGYYGAWSELRNGCTGYHHTSDGNTVVVASGFSIRTPTGATGWYFNNSAP
jgi:hypothetical protein